jgi:hypothetical protein
MQNARSISRESSGVGADDVPESGPIDVLSIPRPPMRVRRRKPRESVPYRALGGIRCQLDRHENRRTVVLRLVHPGRNRPHPHRVIDYLVHEGKYIWRNLEAKRLGGFQVKNQLEFGKSQNWQVGPFLAPANSPDIIACLTKGISQAGPIAYKPTIFCCLPCCITRGKSKARDLVDNDLPIGIVIYSSPMRWSSRSTT